MTHNKYNDVLAMIDDYIYDLLDVNDQREVRKLIDSDPVWEAAYHQAIERKKIVQDVPPHEASSQLIESITEKIEEKANGFYSFHRIVFRYAPISLATAAMILLAVNLYFTMLTASPYEVHLMGQQQQLADTTGSLRLRLADHRTGQPVANAKVELALYQTDKNKSIKLASFETDDQGTASPRIQWPNWPDGQYELRVTAKINGARETLTQPIQLKRDWRLMISSDKPIYQPGQTIHLRALALRKPDLKPLAGREAVFTIADPKGNIIFKQRDVTSRFGIIATDCPLATEIIHGPYTLAVKIGDSESKQTVTVEPYVLPKFKVALTVDRSWYQPGQTIRGTIQSDYFFGKPVAGAKVDIELITSGIGSTTLQIPELKADASGRAMFELRLPNKLVGKPQYDGDARVQIIATITDTAGQKQTRHLSRLVTSQPLRVHIIPEAGRLVKNIANTIYLFVTYPDGKPAKATLSVGGLDYELTTSELGVAMFELTSHEEVMHLAISVYDGKNNRGRTRALLECGQWNDDFLLRPDKAVYRGGESVQLTALGSGVEPIFIDLIKDGQTLLTESVTLQNGRAILPIDLPTDLFGTIKIVGYRYSREGLAILRQRVIYVQQPQQVHITAKLDRSEYRPGGLAKLQLSLTDSQGKPAPGAISLAAVDEAVFHVLAQRPGLEQTFFTLEQELLKPIYAIYNWSPNLTTSQYDSQQVNFERALFSQTANQPDAKNEVLQRLIDEGLFSQKTIKFLRKYSIDELQAMYPDAMSDQFSQVLRAVKGQGSTYSLQVNSYPAKVTLVDHQRKVGLGYVVRTWWILGALSFICLLVILSMKSSLRIADVLIFILCSLFLAAILLPALGRAREIANQSVAGAGMRELDQALEIDSIENGRPTKEQGSSPTSANQPVRVRQWFPETLLWRPQIVTDDQGIATLEIPLADSITSWRLTASAVTATGQLGAMNQPLKVFQPFFVDLNLPVALQRGDEISIPVVVYNYLDTPQTVQLTIENHDWFELLDESIQSIKLQPNEVRSTSYRIRVKIVGQFELQVTARGAGEADAIKCKVTVEPDGHRVEVVQNGSLALPINMELAVPADAIQGSVKAIVKIYPTTFSQVVEGLDAIFQRPYGCFEQTSSTTYPNVLALNYLHQTKQKMPAIEAKAKQYIHLGYQRLLSFEVNGGGFDWFGRPPANRTLTAYGLMEFNDMAKVHNIDPNLIKRTRQWLLKQRQPDGSWEPESHAMHDDPTQRIGDATLAATAYIAWAVFTDDPTDAGPTLRYLQRHEPRSINNPYVIALIANALQAMDQTGRSASPYLDRLLTMVKRSDDSKQAWWSIHQNSRTTFYGSGRSAKIETTALVILALAESGRDANTVGAALRWLIEQKESQGTWHHTQATVLALKALLAGTNVRGKDKPRTIELLLDGKMIRQLNISTDQSQVMQQIDLTDNLTTTRHRLTIRETSDTGAGYQVALRYHVPDPVYPTAPKPLSITLKYDQTQLTVGDSVTATATVINQMHQSVPMAIVDLPIPAGFAVRASDFQKIVDRGQIAKYQITPRSVIIYLRRLSSGQPLALTYQLDATMPVHITAPAAKVYEYYDPDNKSTSQTTRFLVRPMM